jgi:flagellar protein FlaG
MTQLINSLPIGQQATEKSGAHPAPVAARVRDPQQLVVVELPKAVVPKVSMPAVQFSSDAESGRVVVRVVNPETGELVRQIPSEDALSLARALGKLQGVFLQQKA